MTRLGSWGHSGDLEELGIIKTLESAGVAIWTVDLKKGLAQTSPRIRFLFNLPEDTPEWASTECYVEAIHEQDRPSVYDQLGKVQAVGGALVVEFRVTGADRRERWVLARGTSSLDENGVPERVSGAVIDVSDRRRAEEALRESERKLQLAVEAGEIGIWNIDIATLRLDGDSRFYTVFSGSNAPFTFEEAFQLIHEDDRERVREAVEQAIQAPAPAPYACDYRVVHPDGKTLWISGRGRTTVDRRLGTQPISLDGTVMEITDQKRAEQGREEAQRQRRLFETALSNTPDLVYVWNLDHRFIYANAALLGMWSKTWDEAIGKHCLELGYEDWHAAMHDREIDHVVATKETVRGVVPFDGAYGRRMYDYILVPVLSADGKVEAVAGTTRDVTDREHLLEELEVERKKLHSYFQVAPAFFAVLRGRELVFEYANEAYYTLVGHRPIIGLPLAVALPETSSGGQGSDYKDLILSIMDSGKPAVFKERPVMLQRTPGGPVEERYVDLVYQPLFEPDGAASGILSHGVDVTDQVLARREVDSMNTLLELRVEERTSALAEAVREAEAFNHSISHDLRSPLRAMVSTSRILLEEAGPELSLEHRVLLERQAHNAGRLGRLIDELLQLSRLSRVELKRQQLDMTHEARSVADHLATQCRVEIQDGMTGEADPGLVASVWQNLIGNACKFSPEGGSVHVGHNGEAFFVNDTGVGFDMEYAPRIFLPFERLVSDAEFPGTGIGLANVKKIVERHGGRVWVDSAPGKGSTFYFTLE